ncbi:hypothetical protein HQ393_13810 [Chitinibacter bivalviorum]|uniref:Uncharacterized protein n=1 Tax=Chitinibacter bivalviorum TaxID=2739434 RepID=A0A7H9BL44_9NEIS|nr:hypothetical protein [Chitinibacter bivalviorum]QLG89229.1 hypothetical protein HQ393_13810 [Chitinibacter bivalviorum]
MSETMEVKRDKTTPSEQKKKEQKPLAERLEGSNPFDWIKVSPKVETK